jgi:hypothetical protein
VGRDGDSPESGLSDNSPPSGRSLLDSRLEEVVEQQGLELVVLLEGGGDVGQEDRLDDTTTSPHLGDTGVVQVPTVLLSGLTHEHESLGVRDDLGGVKGLLKVAMGRDAKENALSLVVSSSTLRLLHRLTR